MKERPIIFSAESVRAIYEGKKTQTRRVIKSNWIVPEHKYMPELNETITSALVSSCPYGQPGDRLWVREAFYLEPNGTGYRVVYQEQVAEPFRKDIKWTSPLFLSKVNSRLTLEIVSVRVERLQEITFEDMRAEGMTYAYPITEKTKFVSTWDALNAKRGYGWDTNPWVWVLEFKKL